MAQATPTPRGIDIDIDDAALALHTPRLSRTLKNAAWELWMNRSATVGAVMICHPVSGVHPGAGDCHP